MSLILGSRLGVCCITLNSYVLPSSNQPDWNTLFWHQNLIYWTDCTNHDIHGMVVDNVYGNGIHSMVADNMCCQTMVCYFTKEAITFHIYLSSKSVMQRSGSTTHLHWALPFSDPFHSSSGKVTHISRGCNSWKFLKESCLKNV